MMKKIIFILASITLITCDYIDDPIVKVKGGVDESICPTPTFPPNTNTKKNILIEDFTGHKCTGCPAAAYEIDKLHTSLGDQIIAVAIHTVDIFAAPNTSGSSYLTDFRTDGGNSIYGFFIPGTPLPALMVNRLDTFFNPTRLNVKSWELATAVNKITAAVPDVNLQLIASYNPTENAICTFVETEILNDISGDHSIVIMVTEDSIIDWQKYNGAGGDPKYTLNDISDYEHNHVLRKCINGWQGTEIITGGALTGEKIVKGFTLKSDDIASNWKINKLSIVAFVYNNTSKEIIQAVSEKL